MIEYLNGIDGDLLLLLNSMHCRFLDSFMYIATGRWTWVPLYVGLMVLMVHRHGWQRSLVWLGVIGLAVLMADQLCATVIRPLVGRMRPSNELNPLSEMVHIVNGYRGGAHGFPSCHGANSTVLAVMVTLITRRIHITLLVLVWAMLHVYTRIYLGVHYPGDILVGALIGAVCGVTVYLAGHYAISLIRLPAYEYRPGYIYLPSGITAAGAISTMRVRVTCEAAPVGVFFGTLAVIVVLSL